MTPFASVLIQGLASRGTSHRCLDTVQPTATPALPQNIPNHNGGDPHNPASATVTMPTNRFPARTATTLLGAAQALVCSTMITLDQMISIDFGPGSSTSPDRK